MAKDVSNKTIVILIILLLIVSLVGIWIVSDKIDRIPVTFMPVEGGDNDSDNSGTIKLTIEEEGPSVDEATGMISLAIV